MSADIAPRVDMDSMRARRGREAEPKTSIQRAELTTTATGEAHVDVSQLRDRGLRGHCIRQGEIFNIVRYSCEGRGT